MILEPPSGFELGANRVGLKRPNLLAIAVAS